MNLLSIYTMNSFVLDITSNKNLNRHLRQKCNIISFSNASIYHKSNVIVMETLFNKMRI